MKNFYAVLILVFGISVLLTNAQSEEEWSKRKITDDELIDLLETVNEEITQIKSDYANGAKEHALKDLAAYYKDKMSKSYFFDWKKFDTRFDYYIKEYSSGLKNHQQRKEIHLELFPADTKWTLPQTGLNGQEITAYLLRHLARQHKMIDIAFTYYLEDQNKELLNYFVNQVSSLYDNYIIDNYEKEGNSVFEYYRAGYRIYNWLFVHNIFLASEDYTYDNQLELIKTFLYHGADLYDKTEKFNNGNHHTKGLMALALVSILFDEFEVAEKWYDHAITSLNRHLEEEVNSDGFQFERSVHYHIGDIDNYFYVYYLAKLNDKPLPESYTQKFRSMFDALIKIAFPNKTLPVLQDDTDEPWAEYNNIGGVMATGTLLFKDPVYKYFASEKISSSKYWFFRDEDLSELNSINSKKPEINSTQLEETGYYIMRNGWDEKDEVLVISAGLSDKKPDHQHADMLGLLGYSNSNIVLPNYQVRYFLDDFCFFKSSFVKNVAIVDSQSQAVEWRGNSGGSGFGKWLDLPTPKVLTWSTGNDFDLFIGSHDGYNREGINYQRKVIFIKEGFWIVKDSFKSEDIHVYQQFWQGHYTAENPGHIRSTFPDGSGLDIVQLSDMDYKIESAASRGKGRTSFAIKTAEGCEFVTLILPFGHFDNRIDERFPISKLTGDWKLKESTDGVILESNNYLLYINVNSIDSKLGTIKFSDKVDVILSRESEPELYLLNEENVDCEIINKDGTIIEKVLTPVNTEFSSTLLPWKE